MSAKSSCHSKIYTSYIQTLFSPTHTTTVCSDIFIPSAVDIHITSYTSIEFPPFFHPHPPIQQSTHVNKHIYINLVTSFLISNFATQLDHDNTRYPQKQHWQIFFQLSRYIVIEQRKISPSIQSFSLFLHIQVKVLYTHDIIWHHA